MKIPLVNLRKKRVRKAGSPIKNDSSLVNLLSRLPSINDSISYEEWKKEFLERLGYFLFDEGIEKAEEAHHVVLCVKVEKLVRVISKIAHHVNDRSLSPTKITIQARNSLDEAMKSCDDMSTYLKVLSPLNSVEENIVGFTKYNTASILVETGFAEYERLNMCRDILQVLRENFVNPVAEPEHIAAFDKYEKEMESFKKVLLDDVGLLPVLKKQRQLQSPIPPKTLMTEIRRGVLRAALVSKSPVLANRRDSSQKSPEAKKTSKKVSSKSPVRRRPKIQSPMTSPKLSTDDFLETKKSPTKPKKKKKSKIPVSELNDESNNVNRDEGSKTIRSPSSRRRTKDSVLKVEGKREVSSTNTPRTSRRKKSVPLKKTKKPKSLSSMEINRKNTVPSPSDLHFTKQDLTFGTTAGNLQSENVASIPQARFSLSDDEKSMSSLQRKNISTIKATTAKKAKRQSKSVSRERNRLAAMRGQKASRKKDVVPGTQSAVQLEGHVTSNRVDSFELIKHMKPLKEYSDRRLDVPSNGKETRKKKRLSRQRNSLETDDYKNIIHGTTNPIPPKFEKSQSKSNENLSSLLGGLQSEDESSIGVLSKTPYEDINLFQANNGNAQKNGEQSFYDNFVKPLTTSEHNVTGNNGRDSEDDKDIFEDPSVDSSKYLSEQSSMEEAKSRLTSDGSILELQKLNKLRHKKEGKPMIQRRKDREAKVLSPTERKIRNQLRTRPAKPVTPTERQKDTTRDAKKRHSLVDSNRTYSPQKRGHITAEDKAARVADEVAKLQITLEDNLHETFSTDEEELTGDESESYWKFKEELENIQLEVRQGKILPDVQNPNTEMKKGDETNENSTALNDEDDYYKEVESKMGKNSLTENEAEEHGYKAKGGELEVAENIFQFNTGKNDVEMETNHDHSDEKEEEETAATEVEETEATDEGVSLALEMVEKMLSVEGSNDQPKKEEIVPSRRSRDSRFHAHEISPLNRPTEPKPAYFGHSDKPKSEILRRPTKRVEDSGFFSLQSSDSLSSRYFDKSPKGRELPSSSQQKRNSRSGYTKTSSLRGEAMREDRMTSPGKSIRSYDPSARSSRWQVPPEKKRVV